jgi:hypothetical protein
MRPPPPLPPFIFDKKWETNKWTVGTLVVPNAQRIGVIDTPDFCWKFHSNVDTKIGIAHLLNSTAHLRAK